VCLHSKNTPRKWNVEYHWQRQCLKVHRPTPRATGENFLLSDSTMVTDLSNNVPSDATYQGGLNTIPYFVDRVTYLQDTYESEYMTTSVQRNIHVAQSVHRNLPLPTLPHLFALKFNYSMTYDILTIPPRMRLVDSDNYCTDSILEYAGYRPQILYRSGAQVPGGIF